MTPALTAVDTSVAIPYVMRSHEQHAAVRRWGRGRLLRLSGHAVAETYSVLTRLPRDARFAAADAYRLMSEHFENPLTLGRDLAQRLPQIFSERGISGGAVYDGLVALAAAEHHVTLATRDERAKTTYEALGVTTEVVG